MIVFALTRWPNVLPLNFSAAYGLAFCAGVFPKRLPWWLPVGTLLVTDVVLNAFFYQTILFSDYMLVNYFAYAAIYWLGRQFTAQASWLKLVGGGLLGAIVFYFITNTASWLQDIAYAKTLNGWIQALTVGTTGWPETWKFFRNTLMSGGLFTGLIAGAMKLYPPAEPAAEEEPETEEVGDAKPEENRS